MTNLLIGYPDIPAAATVTADYDVDADYPLSNLFGLSRFHISQRDAAGSGVHVIKFDLGSGVTKSANFLALGRANLLQRDNVTGVELRASASDDFATADSIYADTSFDAATLYGPKEEDYFATFAASSAYRYWYLAFDSGSDDTDLALSKAYFGTALDLGRDPEHPREVRLERGVYSTRAGRLYSLHYRGIAHAKAATFVDEVLRVEDTRPVFLMTTSYHKVLNDHRIVFASAENAEYPYRIVNLNDINVDFREVL